MIHETKARLDSGGAPYRYLLCVRVWVGVGVLVDLRAINAQGREELVSCSDLCNAPSRTHNAQGDPGESKMLLDCTDPLMVVFGGCGECKEV